MARPLTKRTNDGKPYERPKCVNEQIDEALELAPADLRARLSIRAGSDPGYLRSECLVHLLREALRKEQDSLFKAVFGTLFPRCERILQRHIPDDVFRDAVDFREEVLGDFSELFAMDKVDTSFDKLDFFECRFNRAFQKFYLDATRKQQRLEHRETMPTLEKEDGTRLSASETLEILAQAYRNPETREDARIQSVAAVVDRLPEKERQAFVLCDVIGLNQSSDDPNETTAASVAGVSDRTIRSRLSSARARLQQLMEET